MSDYKLKVGNVELVALTDAAIERDPLQVFTSVPEDAWESYTSTLTADRKVQFNIGGYIARSDGTTILIDTGLGEGPAEAWGGIKGNMLADMANKGVKPENIDIVAFTHLHLTGWNFRGQGADRRLTFPNARYIIHEVEWDFCAKKTDQVPPVMQESVKEKVLPLQETGKLEVVSGEYRITSELTMVPTPGHTPGHVSILIRSAGQVGMILGDAIHHPIQAEHPEWSPIFDMEPDTSAQTREELLNRLEQENALLAANQFPGAGFGRLERIGGRRIFQAI
jgi:glyoxylase-like metal-dependent hydrolase (beta-lactamase superfamily II)